MKLLAASLVLLSAAMAFAPAVAHADTVTDKKAEYAAARARVARLDHRVERLTGSPPSGAMAIFRSLQSSGDPQAS